MDFLDLYAKIEPLIGFYKEYERLYHLYIKHLNSLHVKSCLDIGCGNGKFLKLLEQNGYEALGIDRSQEMINRALSLGVNAKKLELSSLDTESFDSAVAIGDVLNYMTQKNLENFFVDIYRVLSGGGYFLADINTLYGFEEVTAGVFIDDKEDSFLSIEADFEDDVLDTKITLFEKKENLYQKLSAKIDSIITLIFCL